MAAVAPEDDLDCVAEFVYASHADILIFQATF